MLLSSFFLIASVLVDARLTDGQQLQGELEGIRDGQVRLVVGGEGEVLAAGTIEKLSFSDASELIPPDGFAVELIDGSQVSAQSVSIQPTTDVPRDKAICEVVYLDNSTEKYPLANIRSIRKQSLNAGYSGNDVQLPEQWKEIREKPSGDDLLVIVRNGNLDYLPGVVLGIDSKQIHFHYSGRDVAVPLSKAGGFIFAAKEQSVPLPKFVAKTKDGSVWQLKELTTDGTMLTMTSVVGAQRELSADEIVSIEFIRAGIVYASDLDGQDIDYTPFVQSLALGAAIKELGKPQLDQTFQNSTISVKDDDARRSFKRGLAMKSRSEITYRLARKYQRFQTTVGIDPDAADHGDLELILMADDTEVFRRSIAKSDPPIEIDIPVADANRLTIIVDFGQNLDIGDQLHLGDARFTK